LGNPSIKIGALVSEFFKDEAGGGLNFQPILALLKRSKPEQNSKFLLNLETIAAKAGAKDAASLEKALVDALEKDLGSLSEAERRQVREFSQELARSLSRIPLRLITSCFAAGTPLLTPTGDKLIEQFKVGDLILSRHEDHPDGELEVKEVEAVFTRLGRIFPLPVGGKVIRTTKEHPFWVQGKGWLTAGQLQVDDLLLGHDGNWVVVQDLLDTGEYETVYNLRVADYHTYFVGTREWGFSVWAHNTCEFVKALEKALSEISPKGPTKGLYRRLENLLERAKALPKSLGTGATTLKEGVAEVDEYRRELQRLRSAGGYPEEGGILGRLQTELPSTNDLADIVAEDLLGYNKTNLRSHGQPVYQQGNSYISPDIDDHTGGTWKLGPNPRGLGRPATRTGTYNNDLTVKIAE
jgi:hypothetical protein